MGYSNVKSIHFDERKEIKMSNYDLFISNYALGEISRLYQDYYVRNVIKFASNVYIIWNMTPLHPYFKNNKFVVTNEKPQTGKKNVVLINKEKLF